MNGLVIGSGRGFHHRLRESRVRRKQAFLCAQNATYKQDVLQMNGLVIGSGRGFHHRLRESRVRMYRLDNLGMCGL